MSSQKVPLSPFSVIPAQAGIQYYDELQELWTPAFAGVTIYCNSPRA
jgi:hypothetical protein